MNFTLGRLESLRGSNDDAPESSFAKNGASKRRIRRVLQHPKCECNCGLPFSVLYPICLAFWQLGKTVQDALLWNLQNETSGGKRHWKIAGISYAKHSNMI